MKRKLSFDDIKVIEELREKGHSLGEIAIKYGVSRQCIQQRLTYKKNRNVKRQSYREENAKLKEELRLRDARITHLETELRKLKNTKVEGNLFG